MTLDARPARTRSYGQILIVCALAGLMPATTGTPDAQIPVSSKPSYAAQPLAALQGSAAIEQLRQRGLYASLEIDTRLFLPIISK